MRVREPVCPGGIKWLERAYISNAAGMANEPITYAKPPDADKNDHLGERGEDHVSAGGPRLSEQ